MKSIISKCLALALLLTHFPSIAQVGLYSTGPAVDAAFVRFLNLTMTDMHVAADGNKNALTVTPQNIASPFLSVGTQQAIKGTLSFESVKKNIEIKLDPSEFVTVIAQNDLAISLIREKVEDFNALKASIAFYNADPKCLLATIKVKGHETSIFESVQPSRLVRKQVNPIPLVVEAFCNGQQISESVDMGRLQPGGRYSLFLMPLDQEKKFFYLLDDVAF